MYVRFWFWVYCLQIMAVMLMVGVLVLPWHPEHGTGFQLMSKALHTMLAIGLDPFNPEYIPISQWWIVWVLPLIGGALALRGFIGIMFKRLEGQRVLVSIMCFMMVIGSAWYYATFVGKLQYGFWVEMGMMTFLLLVVFIEMVAPYSDVARDIFGYAYDTQQGERPRSAFIYDEDASADYAYTYSSFSYDSSGHVILEGEVMPSTVNTYSPLCPSCGKINELGTKKCVACGYDLIPPDKQ